MSAHIYKTKAGTRVPSVTGISGLYGDKGGLLYWANQQGLEGKTLEDAREVVATPGSMVHEQVDFWAKGQAWDPGTWASKFSTREAFEEARGKCERSFAAFLQWASYSQFKVVAGEVALVSERHLFGGRLDAAMTADGLALADWKSGSSGKIYADYLFQLAGYAILWDEKMPDNPITDGYHIIRFNNETADFSHHHFASLDEEKAGFLKLRELYDIYKRAKKRV